MRGEAQDGQKENMVTPLAFRHYRIKPRTWREKRRRPTAQGIGGVRVTVPPTLNKTFF
jgi:hypothetical protein